MNAKILDGKKIAEKVRQELKTRVASLSRHGREIRIVSIVVGGEASALRYADAQKRNADAIGIKYDLKKFPGDVSDSAVIEVIDALSRDPNVSGIVIQKPVPGHIDFHKILGHINPVKDIEGMRAECISGLVFGKTDIVPCTAAAVMEHLRAAGVALRGKDVVIVGASEIVGKPLALLLLKEMATVTVCHIATTEAGRLGDHVGRADILIVAVGKPCLINGTMIKSGAVVIDVGTNLVDGKLTGDVDFDSASQKASMMTPVPGGVGPVTVMMLMRNAVEAFEIQTNARQGV
ncbi:MAG TPA: bifunctional 5,10-methylenetetrahydrofolate dehydrogenase/5,10-methenyltetrahydrofolate cyclohydrolase [Candidatus Bathyarchaeia archaeon]|nr:bifunctional 5,10-methylenetetrahydrofolate dehydrogenase/5,10-methenyltetrahydrofolate cyclohydrolase [Candidatus Bathyarchaeia archaeon]